jgi:catechol 2,3-dioxygenase-like lactoylglutathione lyase family enzyme
MPYHRFIALQDRSTMPHIALVVRDCDEAINFYVGKLGFVLVADEYQPEQDKRWVLDRPPAVQPYGKVAVFADLYGNLWDLVEFG